MCAQPVTGRELALALAYIERVQLLCEANHLTPHQQRVALSLLSDRTVAQIARDLCLSVPTIQSQASRIYHELGVRNRIGLVGALLGVSVKEKFAA